MPFIQWHYKWFNYINYWINTQKKLFLRSWLQIWAVRSMVAGSSLGADHFVSNNFTQTFFLFLFLFLFLLLRNFYISKSRLCLKNVWINFDDYRTFFYIFLIDLYSFKILKFFFCLICFWYNFLWFVFIIIIYQ